MLPFILFIFLSVVACQIACPTSDEWTQAITTGDKGTLDEIAEGLCGGNNVAPYSKLATGGTPTCYKYCFTCGGTNSDCVGTVDPSNANNFINVRNCTINGNVCRSAPGCTTNSDDNSGKCDGNSIRFYFLSMFTVIIFYVVLI